MENDLPSIDLTAGFRLGPWRVEPARNVLARKGEETHLENRLMQTLVFMAQHQGEAITREQFFDSVWEGRVVNEEALSRAISMLRSALGDNPRTPEFIRTVPGVGYCLIAEVQPLDTEPAVLPAKPARGIARILPFARGVERWVNLGLSLLFLGALAVVLVNRLSDDGAPQTPVDSAQELPMGDNSIAVLPFVNMSNDEEQDQFADGMTEEILNLLASVPKLRVTARTSSFFFKDSNLPMPQIAEVLNVQHVLEGSVRRDGRRVRITAQLVEAGSDSHVWSETYDVALEDVFDIQDTVASAIAQTLVDSFEGLERQPGSRTDNLAAFENYRAGRLLWWQRSPETMDAAIDHFTRAIEADPGFAPAYAAIADTWLLQVLYGKTQILIGVNSAAPMIEQALALDPDSPEAFAARGLSDLIIGEKADAERDLRHAIELDPDYIPAYAWLSALLSDLGRMPEQGALLQEALARDPLNELLTGAYALNLLSRGDDDSARDLLQGLLRIRPDAQALLVNLSEVERGSGHLVEAWEAASAAHALAPQSTVAVIALADAWLALNEGEQAAQVLVEARRHSPANVNIKLKLLRMLMVGGNLEEAQDLKDNLFPEDISWIPAASQRTYHHETGLLWLFRGDAAKALEHLLQALDPVETQLYENDQLAILTLVVWLARELGQDALAEERLQTAERVIGHARVNGIDDAELYYAVAVTFALRGETDRAMQALQQAYDRGWRILWLLENDLRLASLRGTEAFDAVVEQVAADLLAAQKVVSQAN